MSAALLEIEVEPSEPVEQAAGERQNPSEPAASDAEAEADDGILVFDVQVADIASMNMTATVLLGAADVEDGATPAASNAQAQPPPLKARPPR